MRDASSSSPSSGGMSSVAAAGAAASSAGVSSSSTPVVMETTVTLRCQGNQCCEGTGQKLVSDLFWLDQHFDLHVSIRWGKKDSSFTSFGTAWVVPSLGSVRGRGGNSQLG